MATKKQDVFHVLDKVDANEYKRAKGKLSYLSWTDALTGVLRIYPDTTWVVHEFPMLQGIYEVHHTDGNAGDGTPIKLAQTYQVGFKTEPDVRVPYLRDKSGCFVKVSVTIEGRERTEMLPVLDHRNKTLPNPDVFQINTSIKRCLAKCLALHGLGLYIYRGEDLPFEDEVPAKKPTTKPKVTEVIAPVKALGAKQK